MEKKIVMRNCNEWKYTLFTGKRIIMDIIHILTILVNKTLDFIIRDCICAVFIVYISNNIVSRHNKKYIQG